MKIIELINLQNRIVDVWWKIKEKEDLSDLDKETMRTLDDMSLLCTYIYKNTDVMNKGE